MLRGPCSGKRLYFNLTFASRWVEDDRGCVADINYHQCMSCSGAINREQVNIYDRVVAVRDERSQFADGDGLFRCS